MELVSTLLQNSGGYDVSTHVKVSGDDCKNNAQIKVIHGSKLSDSQILQVRIGITLVVKLEGHSRVQVEDARGINQTILPCPLDDRREDIAPVVSKISTAINLSLRISPQCILIRVERHTQSTHCSLAFREGSVFEQGQ